MKTIKKLCSNIRLYEPGILKIESNFVASGVCERWYMIIPYTSVLITCKVNFDLYTLKHFIFRITNYKTTVYFVETHQDILRLPRHLDSTLDSVLKEDEINVCVLQCHIWLKRATNFRPTILCIAFANKLHDLTISSTDRVDSVFPRNSLQPNKKRRWNIICILFHTCCLSIQLFLIIILINIK